jgi:hypothetical protein
MRRLNQAAKERNNMVLFISSSSFCEHCFALGQHRPQPSGLKIKLGLMGKDIANLWLQLYVLSRAEEILTVMLTELFIYIAFLTRDYGLSP